MRTIINSASAAAIPPLRISSIRALYQRLWVNYVALLGWSPEGNQEIFSLEDMIREFDYRRMSKSPAVFDMTKLRWMNGEYIKSMDFDRFYEMAEPYIRRVIKRIWI